MRLIRLQLENFRRFEQKQSLQLDESVIAIVGPNESGKSSILDALRILGSKDKIPSSDVTRGGAGPAVITGIYSLDEEDFSRIEDFTNGVRVTHLIVEVRSDGPCRAQTHPPVTRDLTVRASCRDMLERLSTDPFIEEDKTESGPPLAEVIKLVREGLASEAETLPPPVLQAIRPLYDRLRQIFRKQGGDAAAIYNKLSSQENYPTQAALIQSKLHHQSGVAVFGQGDRELRGNYEFEAFTKAPHGGLRHLFHLAGLDLESIKDLVKANDSAGLIGLFDRANRTLEERFRAGWTQAAVYPRLIPPTDGVIRVMVQTENDSLFNVEERSEGLRWFIALHAFLATSRTMRPILLVDEAETHLHYDAQSDLIEALMRQNLAPQVIYTTHSIGCLPPDLGSGIRVALPVRGRERSTIGNSYWTAERSDGSAPLGYDPLLIALGARLLPLTAPRHGLVVEGPSDAILLPSLIREAAELDRLSYRVMPGLSELTDTEFESIDHIAGRLVCLTDGDDQGNSLATRLDEAGVPSESVFSLSRIADGCTLEDLVSEEAFCEAVNKEIEVWDLGIPPLQPDALPATGRWNWMKVHWEAFPKQFASLKKNSVAQRLAEMCRKSGFDESARKIVAPRVSSGLKDLHAAFAESLSVRRDRGGARSKA